MALDISKLFLVMLKSVSPDMNVAVADAQTSFEKVAKQTKNQDDDLFADVTRNIFRVGKK